MIKVLKYPYLNDNNSLCIGTHNGIFHCDEVIAISILNILYDGKKEINVIRTRNLEILNEKAKLIIDIGAGKFDHHQKGGNGKRTNGIEYASSGLVWKEFGKDIIQLLSKSIIVDDKTIEILFNEIDENIIQDIDKEDNGQKVSYHQFQFIKDFLPNWNSETVDYDKNFELCINISSEILKNIITNYIAKHMAREEIKHRIESTNNHIKNVLVLPNQTIPWTDDIIDYNEKMPKDNCIDFVVFPYPDGGYALQCVPPSKENLFAQRISLPDEWAGETINLPQISKIISATFCHRGKFFARALDFNDIIKMCEISTNKHYNENMSTKKLCKK